jgi:hypothetical protein
MRYVVCSGLRMKDELLKEVATSAVIDLLVFHSRL